MEMAGRVGKKWRFLVWRWWGMVRESEVAEGFVVWGLCVSGRS